MSRKRKIIQPPDRWIGPNEPWPDDESSVEMPQPSTPYLAFARTPLGHAIADRNEAGLRIAEAAQHPEVADACRRLLLDSCSRLRKLGEELEVARTLFLIAQLDLLLGDTREGKAALKLCLSYPLPAPERAELYFALGMAALHEGNLSESESHLARFEELRDARAPVQRVYAHLVQAEHLVKEGDARTALALIRQRYYQAPHLPERTLYLRCAGRILAGWGHYAEATWLFDYASAVDTVRIRPPAAMRILLLRQDLVAHQHCLAQLATLTPTRRALPRDLAGQELLVTLALSRF